MKGKVDRLSGLQKIAKLKSDLEMRRFSAYRASVVATKARITALRQGLDELYDQPQDFSIAGARLVNTLAHEKMRALQEEEMQLNHMMPGYEAARQLALREFGRAETLHQLRMRLSEEGRLKRQRQQP